MTTISTASGRSGASAGQNMSFFRRPFRGNKHQEAATTMPHGFTPPESTSTADTSIPIGTEPLTPLPLDTTPAAVSPAPLQTRPLEPPKAYATAQPSKQIRWG